MRSLFRSRAERTPQVFNSYDDALDACGGKGYQADELVRVVVEKNIRYRDDIFASRTVGLESLRAMVGVAALGRSDTLRVIDFGGGGGNNHSTVKAIIGDRCDIRWNVVETPAMAKAANKKLAGDGLKFFDNLDDAVADLGHVDLAFTSGTLPSTRDPLGFLSRLIEIRADHLYITRTAFNLEDDTLIGVQSSRLSSNGPGPLPAGFADYDVHYPVTLVSKAKAEALIRREYSIRFYVEEDRNAYRINGLPFHMYGYFCDLKSLEL